MSKETIIYEPSIEELTKALYESYTGQINDITLKPEIPSQLGHSAIRREAEWTY